MPLSPKRKSRRTRPKASPQGQNIFPGLYYRDAHAAIEWLGKAFGFRKLLVVPGPNDTVAHAEMIFEGGVIMLGSGRAGDGPESLQNPRSAAETGVYVFVGDLEAHFARAKAAGAEIVRDIQPGGSGKLQYSARDVEGHGWTFGRYRPQE